MRRRASVIAALLENDELLLLSRLVRRALHDEAKLHKPVTRDTIIVESIETIDLM
jgi:hypothetical protein